METQLKKEAVATHYNKLYIGGRWQEASTNTTIEIRSPHDRSLTGTTPLAGKEDIDKAVAAAKLAFEQGPWPKLSPQERQQVIRRFDELYKDYAEELAVLTTKENGSPVWFTKALAGMIGEQTAAYLRAAEKYPWEIRRPTTFGQTAVLRREPVGVVAAIIPWNAPQQSALVKIIPALLAGCTVVFKPTPETSLNGIVLAEIFAEAGLPEGVFSVVPADREVSEYLVGHPGINKIAFTGSTAAGKKIAAIAGQQLKKFSLELGGKSAAIILPDADLEATMVSLKFTSYGNNAESCVAQSRILAQESHYEEVVAAFSKMVATITVGDPADENNFIGPMVNEVQYKRVTGYIDLGIKEGARVVIGGPGRPDGEGLDKGFYVKPTIFADVNNKMRIAREEIFGPVMVIIPYKDEAEAIAIANDSEYGLSGSVFTANVEHGLEVARQIRTGLISVNASKGDFDSPFGGYKNSGIGREFGTSGLDEYVLQKSITI